MIVPISIVSTDGFLSLRELMFNSLRTIYFSNYAMRPGKLFDGVEKHLNIFVGEKGCNCKVKSSKYYRWNAEERKNLFELFEYTDNSKDTWHNNSIPKIGNNIGTDIIKKIKKNIAIEICLAKTGQHTIYHTRKLRYFLQFLDCAPKIFEEDGSLRVTSELKKICFDKVIKRNGALATYLSTLFFWYYISYSDCRNLNKREVVSFPLNLNEMDEKLAKEISIVVNKLLQELQKNSFYTTANYKKYGLLKMQTFQPRKSKRIVDSVDTILAKHYGFTEEELDFIINYDIKYRMGKELNP